ncbi:Cytochrome P450 [Sesbania bispinosa]|nr:Cytochrome P450 [Sesbania bispinosa]
MAGTDTSAITTEWALAELINLPHVMEKARQEIDSVIGKSRLIQESYLPNLPYLRAIVKETLRIHPTAPLLGRESSESSNVCGYEIPTKSLLFVNLWSMSLGQRGRRVCPGASLALHAVPINLPAMIQCFEWKVDGTVNMEEKPAMTLPRAHPLVCVPVPRFNGISSSI